MARDGVIVPAETSVLCEGCGYTLDGLPTTGQCPECGLAIGASSTADGRRPPAWEDENDARPIAKRFWSTSAEVIFHPARFYRTLATRRQDRAALAFARAHWGLSATLLAAALSIHAWWFEGLVNTQNTLGMLRYWGLWMAVTPLTLLFLWGTTRIASRLTAWEAAYRGYRLPLSVVRRALYYHAAHFTPVAVLAFVTTAANALLSHWRVLTELSATRYLLILCIEVILGAGFLFKTYWTGMKNTMYANH